VDFNLRFAFPKEGKVMRSEVELADADFSWLKVGKNIRKRSHHFFSSRP
jgi:predicted transcriptional regulator